MEKTMHKKLSNLVNSMKKGPYSTFPPETQRTIKRTFIIIAVIACVALGLKILFFQ